MSTAGVRLDKWLWAARFFRTRAQAKTAIDGGKVVRNGERAKASKNVEVGDELRVRTGHIERTVIVDALSEQRRGAPEAALLYHETDASIAARAREAAIRSALKGSWAAPAQRPDKRDRRALDRLKRGDGAGLAGLSGDTGMPPGTDARRVETEPDPAARAADDD